MKREILFRGKKASDGEWVYGWFIGMSHVSSDKSWIRIESGVELLVDISTVGQFTGLTDKSGIKIFEGDICGGHSDGFGVIEWTEYDGGWMYEFSDKNSVGVWEIIGSLSIVGNIHDNPELLK